LDAGFLEELTVIENVYEIEGKSEPEGVADKPEDDNNMVAKFEPEGSVRDKFKNKMFTTLQHSIYSPMK